jgi:exopolysaccharide production protein ExoY
MLKAHSASTTPPLLSDLCCIGLGYFAAGQIALRLSARQLFVFPDRGPWEGQYSALLLLALLSWVTVTSYSETYHSRRTESLPFASRTLARSFILWVLLTVAGVFIFKLANVSRQFTVYFLCTSSIFVWMRQLATMIFLRRLRRFGYNWRKAVIVGDRSSCERFAQQLTTTYPMGYNVIVRAVNDDSKDTQDSAFASPGAIDDVFIVGTDYAKLAEGGSDDVVTGLLKQGKSVHIIPGLLDARLFRQSFSDVAGIPVISLMKGQLDLVQALAKRTADVVGSAVLLLLLSPFLVVIATIIKVTSKGPVLFRQIRIGYNGERFALFKFRTMVANAEDLLRNSPVLYAEYLANNFKLPKNRDPRITRLGRFLRATSLDEMPQLINVLKGNMSLVGPRPVVPVEVEKYGDAAGLFLSVKPGMTGHWQVSGRSEVTAYDKRIELDLEYIRDQSLGKDFEILLRTVPVVLRGRGAH